MKKIYNIALLGAVLSFASCDLDYYDPNKVSGDEKLTEVETFEGLLNQCYSPLINTLYQSSDYILFAEGGTDIWEEPKRGNSYQRYHSYDGLLASDNYAKKVFLFSYSAINNCNAICARAANVTDMTDAEKTIAVAEARCLRAYYYSILVEQFGNVALVLTESGQNGPELYPQRSTIEAIYAAIIEDLKYAEENLPVNNDPGRVSKKAAKGLLCRAYIQGAGYNLTDTDGISYLQKAYDEAADFINNKSKYGAELYSDFADVFNEKNNRSNKEFLFYAAGNSRTSEGYSQGNYSQCEVFRHFLPSLGSYTDLGLVDKTSNFVYGRPNSNIFLPSKYLMECMAEDENDVRFQYSFISTYAGYSVAAWGSSFEYGNGQFYSKTITENLADKYEIDSKWVGSMIYEHFELVNNGNGELGVWNSDGSAYTTEAESKGNILHPEVPMAAPQEGEHWQYAIYCSLKTMSDEERAKYPCFVNNVFDLYGADGSAVAETAFGTSSATSIQTGIYPAMSKFNMPGSEFFGSNAQRKTVDMPIMRFAEVYMIAAEAAVRLGKSDAKQYIDVLRTRAHASAAPSSIDMDYIFDEYARELCGEYQRWYILKRNNAFKDRLSKYNKRAIYDDNKCYLRPIPQTFLDQILNREEFGQNPGY